MYHGKSCYAWSQKYFEKKFFLISCPIFDVWRHLQSSFNRFSVICRHNLLFRHFNLIFKWCLSWYELFSMIMNTIWKKIYIMSRFWSLTSYISSVNMIVLTHQPSPLLLPPSCNIRGACLGKYWGLKGIMT